MVSDGEARSPMRASEIGTKDYDARPGDLFGDYLEARAIGERRIGEADQCLEQARGQDQAVRQLVELVAGSRPKHWAAGLNYQHHEALDALAAADIPVSEIRGMANQEQARRRKDAAWTFLATNRTSDIREQVVAAGAQWSAHLQKLEREHEEEKNRLEQALAPLRIAISDYWRVGLGATAAAAPEQHGDSGMSVLGRVALDPSDPSAILALAHWGARFPTVVVVSRGAYGAGVQVAQAYVVGRLAHAGARELIVTWVDTVGSGSSAGPLLSMLDVDDAKDLLDGQVWSEPDHVAERLRRLTDRIAYVRQRCLRDEFPDLDAYNAQAGALSEPHHLLVVTGFPRGFTEETAQRLRSIMDGGGGAGVAVLIVTDESVGTSWRVEPDRKVHMAPGQGQPHWWSDAYVRTDVGLVGHEGRLLSLWPGYDEGRRDFLLPIEPLSMESATARRIVHGYATASANAEALSVPLAAIDRDADMWTESSATGISVPIGTRGQGGPVKLQLGPKLLQNVLVGGVPGSGKSSLFHTLITAAVRRYSPDELELYLLDFKQGVEFKPYAEGGLPHARVVAIESEREFGVSVLRGLESEIARRGKLFREASAADSLTVYRERTGHALSRILLVIDEFQVLFAEEDAIANTAAGLLDFLVRQGRAFGIHSILGTQSLRGIGAGGSLRSTFDQIAIRIILRTSEADSRLFLAEENVAAARLTRSGEAIFNADGGLIESNTAFQVAWTEDSVRDAVVREAAARMADRRPLVFDGSADVAPEVSSAIAEQIANGPVRGALRLHVGEAVTIGGSAAITLHRRGGANLLVVGRSLDHLHGSLAVALLTARASAGSHLSTTIIDCLGIDEPEGEYLLGLAELMPDLVVRRRPRLAEVLDQLNDEVHRRLDADDYGADRVLLVVNGLHRARELGDENTYPSDDDPRGRLIGILRDGPDVGVHSLLTADTPETVIRRIGREGLGAIGSRLVMQCGADGSRQLLNSEAASALGDRYALLHEPDDQRTEKIRPFPVPPSRWLADSAARLG